MNHYQLKKTVDPDLFQRGNAVLWHNHLGTRSVPIPGVVLGQKESQVMIRVRLHETLQEVTVDRHELAER